MIRALIAALLAASCAPQPSAKDSAPPASRPQQCQPPHVVLVKRGQTVAPNSTYYSDGMPPDRFRGDSRAQIEFHSPAEVTRICSGGAAPTCGLQIMACEQSGKLIMPNPCGSGTEYYGRLLCHELGHLNGWPGTHGD